MMKKLLGLFAIVMMSASGMAQTGPKIEFKAETIDYGTVVKGDDSGLRVFEFTNTGNADLVITDVKSSCGCTVPSKPTEPIAPGKTGKIEVQYNMNPGPISKTITVTSNAVNKQEGTILLKITGKVINQEDVNLLEKKKTFPNS